MKTPMSIVPIFICGSDDDKQQLAATEWKNAVINQIEKIGHKIPNRFLLTEELTAGKGDENMLFHPPLYSLPM